MYQDAGYGDNWQPETNNARRFDPYTRSCTVIASLFVVGLVLIIIVVLSLIPIYISHKSSSSTQNTNIQTSKAIISNYQLSFLSPSDTFDSEAILSDTNNRLRLQASLTSLLQNDSITSGSIIEIDSSTVKRRDISNQLNLTCHLTITNNKICSTVACLNQYNNHINHVLTNPHHTPLIRYELSNSTMYWLSFRLPRTTSSDVSYVYIDPKTIASVLSNLLSIDETENQPLIENSTSTIIS